MAGEKFLQDTWHQGNQNHHYENHFDGIQPKQGGYSVENDPNLDSDTKRRIREQLSGYYIDKAQDFSVTASVDLGKYTTALSPLDKVARKATLGDNDKIGNSTQTAEEFTEEVYDDAVVIDKESIGEGNGVQEGTVDEVQLSDLQLAEEIESLYDQYQNELEKGENANIDRLCELAGRMFTLFHRMSSRHDQDESGLHTSHLKHHVKSVQDTYNHIGSIILTVASSILGVLGGIGGCVGSGVQMVGGTRLITAAKAENIIKFANSASGIGQAVHAPSKLFDESGRAAHTVENHRYEEKKRHRDIHAQNSQKASQTGESALQNLRESLRQNHSAKKAAMGVNAE